MADVIRRLWGLSYMPHGMCYLWDPPLVWLHVISDTLIALAYLAIPIALIYFIRRRRDVPFNWMFLCFGIFIVACGATHAMEVWNVWHANYFIAGGIKAVTAIASVSTAFLFVRLIPEALAIPSPTQLRQSEQRYRMACKVGKVVAYEWEVSTGVMVRSGENAAILRADEQDNIASQLALSKVHQDDSERLATALANLSPEKPDLRIDYRMVRPDGSVVWMERSGRAHFDDRGGILRIVGMMADVTERKQIEEELHRISYQLMRAQDIERRKIAQDLHESAGQTLAALKITLKNIENFLEDNDERWAESLESARGLADDAVREVRVISYLMHPHLLDDVGLGATLRWFVRGFGERSGIETFVDVAEDLNRQSKEIDITIFRIVQEALTNVHRHSGSSSVLVRVACERQRISVEIQDKGCGLASSGDSDHPNAVLGVGIAGMRERVRQLQGIFQIESAPGYGTTVRAILPLVQSQAASA